MTTFAVAITLYLLDPYAAILYVLLYQAGAIVPDYEGGIFLLFIALAGARMIIFRTKHPL